jgi:hypothetical protein
VTHAALAQYEGVPGFRTYARVFGQIEKELGRCQARVEKVEIIGSRDPRSALRRFFTLEKADQADWWLSVEASGPRPIKIVAPFRRGLTLPYTLEIGLSCRVPFAGGLRRNMLLSARWDLQPATHESRGLAGQLDALKLPSINWRHDSGGIPIVLNEASRLSMTRDPAWPGGRVIVSGYQGFLFNLGPRIAKYVAFAPKLESLFTSWTPRPAAAGKPAPSQRPQAPLPAVAEPTAQAAPPSAAKAPDDQDGADDPPLELPDKATVDAVMVHGDAARPPSTPRR